MSEEFGGFDAGVDTQSGNEQWNEVSEAEIVRVRESIWNARKAAGQKAKSQRTNRQLALMLSFIFKYIDDEFLVSFVYTQMTTDHVHVISLFGLFLPYLNEYMDITPYKPLYSDVRDNLENRVWSEEPVVQYYKELLEEFPELQKIDRSVFVEMVTRQVRLNILNTDRKLTKEQFVKGLYS